MNNTSLPVVVIAAAGPPRPQVLTLSSNIKSASMVPINGKPILGWMLDEFLDRGFQRFDILAPENDAQLQRYVSARYARFDDVFSIKEVEKANSPKGLAHSLLHGLCDTDHKDALIILGHTLVPNVKLSFDEDWVGYGTVKEESTRWCYVEVDKTGRVKNYIDKPNTRTLPDSALIGVYYIKNVSKFCDSIKFVIDNDVKIGGSYQISSAFQRYKKMKAVEFKEWLDCGNVTGLHKTKRKLISARSFNSISVDEDIGILTKKSSNSTSFHQEFSWYVSLPKKLISLAPRVIEFKPVDAQQKYAEFSLEYYGYSSLEEYWVYHNSSFDVWVSVLNHLFAILRIFREFKVVLSHEDFKSIYRHKTESRLSNLRSWKSNIDWHTLLSYPSLVINDQEYDGLPILLSPIFERSEGLYHSDHCTIIHGDFHFANILYDVNSRLVKLIDPRGNFGSSGIFGDCKYDFAKLRHSISGGYNYIVNDLFHVKTKKNKIDFEIEQSQVELDLAAWFDNKVQSEGFDIEQIKLIEGLLFLSMIPLHADHESRQLAIFTRAIQLLNNVCHPHKEFMPNKSL